MIDSFQSVLVKLYGIQRVIQKKLSAELFSLQDESNIWAWGLALGTACLFGVIHALTPGHGKAFIATYLLNRGGSWRDGLSTALKTILTHVLGAVVLVLGAVVILDVSLGMRPADYPGIRTFSYGLICVIAVLMLLGAFKNPASHQSAGISKKAGHWIPYLAGLSPCPLTTIILLAALARDTILAGMLMVTAMTIGMIMTVGIVAVTVVLLRSHLLSLMTSHEQLFNRIIKGLQIAGALGLLLIGLFMLQVKLKL